MERAPPMIRCFWRLAEVTNKHLHYNSLNEEELPRGRKYKYSFIKGKSKRMQCISLASLVKFTNAKRDFYLEKRKNLN